MRPGLISVVSTLTSMMQDHVIKLRAHPNDARCADFDDAVESGNILLATSHPASRGPSYSSAHGSGKRPHDFAAWPLLALLRCIEHHAVKDIVGDDGAIRQPR